jgi:hypothetical protein
MLRRAKLALCFQIPSQASLHVILKPHRPFCYANSPALSLREEIIGRKYGVALGLQAGMCCEKASASPLASVFSATNPAFAQRIKPVISIFLFDSFVPTLLALRANLRLLHRAPAPMLGCVYLGNPWFKIFSREKA